MTVAPPIKRDCACPKARHTHGTRQAYSADGCRCVDCRAANAARRYRSRKRVAFGRAEPKPINGIGTRRRLQALAVKGWSTAQMGRRLGITTDRVWGIMTALESENVSVANAKRVSALYEALWDKEPPRTTVGERSVAARTIARANRLGWAPSAAWDDIDDPDEQPKGMGRNKRMSKNELVQEALILRYFGLSDMRIAQQLGISESYLRGIAPVGRAS